LESALSQPPVVGQDEHGLRGEARVLKLYGLLLEMTPIQLIERAVIAVLQHEDQAVKLTVGVPKTSRDLLEPLFERGFAVCVVVHPEGENK
jgi:predicted GTPase